ncbi:unnamed protein product [Auanema sp. JU1783]|nr:unnamed protein product [Auanema sp. JU1783]
MTDNNSPIPLKELFDMDRISSPTSRLLVFLYSPVGFFVFLCRIFLGLHTFFVACLLRKSTVLRTAVLRIMCALLGIIVKQEGERDPSVKLISANHVSALDHLAVDLVESCILPSVWDIPSILRWCFGYADFGARSGRDELVRQGRKHIQTSELPILSLPEGAITSGKSALLKFSTWPAEVSDSIQPISLHVWRPIQVNSSILGATWWSDVFWFMFLPMTVIHLKWLPVLRRNEDESVEDFSKRLSKSIAEDLSIQSSSWTNLDAAEAVKRRFRAAVNASAAKKKPLDPRKMDEIAMRIKQSHPKIPLLVIRWDLDKTKDYNETIERIKSGKLNESSETAKLSGKVPTDHCEWKKLFDIRKWEMIECNRANYLKRMNRDLASTEQ